MCPVGQVLYHRHIVIDDLPIRESEASFLDPPPDRGRPRIECENCIKRPLGWKAEHRLDHADRFVAASPW